MAGPVYDPEKGGYKMPPRKRIPRRLSEEEKEAKRVADWEQHSPYARQVLDEERKAAAGKAGIGEASEGGESDASGDSKGFNYHDEDGNEENDTRTALSNQEANAGFYRPESGQKRSLGEIGGLVKSGLRKQRNLWAIGIISSIVGGGWMFVLLAIMSGPLQFVHMGKSMEQFHLTIQEAQTGALALKLARNIYHVTQGNRQKTHMGYLGNRYADKIEANMERKGIKPDYTGGFFRGYVIDPTTIDRTNYPGIAMTLPKELEITI